ncbi:hypothetical protein FHU10_5067 [Serratia fonticola]|uniref:Uncharacterized protein n=1 Tax=Serratia fonticola TaxID=47917 RepID=A0A542BNB7_SERFO|nr:hypothetical protein [Serratia fonticola]TQI80080.1 hypothetical protein FHU09_2637 [Serratia fonticola]TQI97895.1 hypothetical protein FHU11_3407 [Serratia fonticola]TVZ72392.1 hypothetical protein FHU10_5067 [Serratia fonticola]
MKIDKDNILDLLKEKVSDYLYPLKMGGSINEEAFNELLNISEEATRLFKGDSLVPKRLLSEIYLVSVGVESENVYLKNKLLSGFSEKIMNCFNLILAGESVDDKRDTGPRII